MGDPYDQGATGASVGYALRRMRDIQNERTEWVFGTCRRCGKLSWNVERHETLCGVIEVPFRIIEEDEDEPLALNPG